MVGRAPRPQFMAIVPTLPSRHVLATLLLGLVFAGALVLTRGASLEPADYVMNNGSEVQTLDPATVTGVPEGRVLRAIFEGLIVKHPKTLEPLPGGAESWEVSEDGLTWTFHIRRGAQWTNGDELTAEDWIYSWRRFLHPLTASYYAYQLWYVAGARQYTRQPEDRSFDASPTGGLWYQRTSDGQVKVGLHGYLLEHMTGEVSLTIPSNPEDKPTIHAGDQSWTLPFSLTNPASNPKAPTSAADALARCYGLESDDESGWLLKGSLTESDWNAVHANGVLLDGATYRAEVADPQHLKIWTTDSHTLHVTLNSPTPYFLDLTGFYPTFPVNRRNIKEAQERWPDRWEIEWLRAENIVTNGPFKLIERRVNDRIRLAKNETYWDADNVAMNSIDILAIEQDSTMLNMYLTGGCDAIDRVNTNVVQELWGREDFQPTPYLGTYFYRFNVNQPPYDDVRVRQALSMVIPRQAICDKVMKMGQVPASSLTPSGIGAYTPPSMNMGSPEEARMLLAAAGYPGGKDFPPVEIHYNTSEAHSSIAQVIALTWQDELGIRTKLRNEEWKVYLDTQQNLRFQVSRSAWIGDYADPNTFIDMFVTGGENNKTGWGNPEYDRLVKAAGAELDPQRRLQFLGEAEALLLDEMPILPIYYYVTQNLTAPRLGGNSENVLDEHFPKFWYWMDDAELAEKRANYPKEFETVAPHGPPEGLYSPAQLRERQQQ